jgi:hypothetical protein
MRIKIKIQICKNANFQIFVKSTNNFKRRSRWMRNKVYNYWQVDMRRVNHSLEKINEFK